MYKHLFALAAAACLAAPAHAEVLTQWNFNSAPPDGSASTGTTTPSVGAGSASALGGVTVSFASGDSNGGSSDPTTGSPTNDSGWQTSTYPAQGTGDKSRGTQYLVSTVGYEDIVISYDLRHSNTSSRYEAVQYTLDGTTWIDAGTRDGNAGDAWFNGRTFDLSGVTGADNNASFGFRVVATFAPGTSGYLSSNPASSYATSGTWRFDMVTVSANPAPIPEPGTLVMLFAGLAAVAFVARRRS
jgi:hypothetical protein